MSPLFKDSVIIAAEKEQEILDSDGNPKCATAVYHIAPTALDVGRTDYRRGLELFKESAESGEWKSYPEEIRMADIPPWGYYNNLGI